MIETRTFRFAPAEGVPNNPDLPALVLPGALAGDPETVRATMERNGWGGTWLWSVFDYHHYHPDAHEALAVVSGWAELTLGGPGGERLRVAAGDVLILPAGTGHKLETSGDGFQVCGAYPPGQERFATCRAGEGPMEIEDVALPPTDPTTGGDGPLLDAWR